MWLSTAACLRPCLLLPAQQVASPFFSFRHNRWFIRQQTAYHVVWSTMRLHKNTPGPMCKNGWHNPFTVYLRRPLYFLSAHATGWSHFRRFGRSLGFARRECLEAFPLHLASVALQRLEFMRQLEDMNSRVISRLISRFHTTSLCLAPKISGSGRDHSPTHSYKKKKKKSGLRRGHIKSMSWITFGVLEMGRHMGESLTSS